MFSSRSNRVIRIYKTITLLVVLYGCEIWSLTLREKHTEGVSEYDSEEIISTEERRSCRGLQ
jgi:hypothetical protein